MTEAQSSALLQAIKTVIGPDSNITHLGHAAMVLTLLRSNPLLTNSSANEESALYSPCWLNGRRYLDDGRYTKSYIPICQTVSPIIFPNLEKLTLGEEATREEVREVLVRACLVATGQYGEIRRRKSMLPDAVALLEYLGSVMIRYTVHSSKILLIHIPFSCHLIRR